MIRREVSSLYITSLCSVNSIAKIKKEAHKNHPNYYHVFNSRKTFHIYIKYGCKSLRENRDNILKVKFDKLKSDVAVTFP